MTKISNIKLQKETSNEVDGLLTQSPILKFINLQKPKNLAYNNLGQIISKCIKLSVNMMTSQRSKDLFKTAHIILPMS